MLGLKMYPILNIFICTLILKRIILTSTFIHFRKHQAIWLLFLPEDKTCSEQFNIGESSSDQSNNYEAAVSDNNLKRKSELIPGDRFC